MLAARIVDQAHVGHAAVGFGTVRALLPHADGVETDISATPAARITLPGPGAAGGVEGHLVAQQLSESRAGRFGHPLDGRFAQTQPA